MGSCDNVSVTSGVSAMADAGSAGRDQVGPAHVLVVGGSTEDWEALGRSAWATRRRDLGVVAADLGVEWLTLRPYSGDGVAGLAGRLDPAPDAEPVAVSAEVVGSCTVIVDPAADGRERFAAAMRAIGEDQVNEASVANVLYEPADCEPDLVLVLGPATRLPPSLVWELAYAELVFTEVAWGNLEAGHLVAAVAEYAGRRRRFGGLDA
jgi:hypothetical protein